MFESIQKIGWKYFSCSQPDNSVLYVFAGGLSLMQKRKFGKTNLEVTPVGLGTWVFGGWPWHSVREKDCEAAIEAALEGGVNLIDTAPVYGGGRSEVIVGRTLRRLGVREQVVLTTKAGLSWAPEGIKKKVWHDNSSRTLRKELEASLKRLQTDFIDIYQIHWPDEKTPLAETMEAMRRFKEEGKIKVIGVSNFNREQVRESLKYAPVESLQPSFHYFKQEAAKDLFPFCLEQGLGTLTYGTLCKGLLTGKFSLEKRPNDPVRNASFDEVFEREHYRKSLQELESLKKRSAEAGLTLAQWVIRWTIQQPGVTCALVGARHPKQVRENLGALLT